MSNDSNSNAILVSRIKSKVAELNLSMQELETRCGFSSGLISRWIKANSPSIDKVIRIARELNVSVSYLVGEDMPLNEIESPPDYTEQLLNRTKTDNLLWRELSEEQAASFEGNIYETLYSPDKFDNKVTYYCTSGDVWYLLSVQWTNDYAKNVDCKLTAFTAMYGIYPVEPVEHERRLMTILRYIDMEIFSIINRITRERDEYAND